MVGSLGRHGTLCAQHFASIFATSRTCWATDTWATNYRSWAHAAAGALIHPEASASLLVGTRHITISFRWHAQLLPITIARAPSSEDNLSTVARMLRGADVFRTEWIPARAAVSFDVSTFGCPVRFVVATLAAVARDGDHTASCEVQIEERTTMEGSVGGSRPRRMADVRRVDGPRRAKPAELYRRGDWRHDGGVALYDQAAPHAAGGGPRA